jgi:ubiquinol-cytochrome c reductase cytochrome b subunit
MSGPSSYQPKPGFERWLDQRLPIMRMVHDSFVDYPTPRNLNYFWTFGAILTLCLIAQIVTGIVLAMHYVPSVGEAFNSVQRIKRDVPFGWLIQNIHATGASMFFLAVYIHMFRGLYYGSYKAPREILWILGVVIYLLMMATAFLGYVLPWGQMSFWGATVITNFFTAIPVVGEPVQQWLMGGFAIDNATLNRFFSLHYLLPFVIFGVVILHVWALHVTGQNNPDGIEPKDKADTVPFTPHATIKDLFATAVFLIMFAVFVFFLPDALGHPDNYTPADPLKTPPHIVPEWYLLPFYAILRAIDFAVGPISAKLGGLILMVGAIAVLVVLPWLDTSKVRSMRYRPVARIFFLIFVLVCLTLGWCGAQSPDKVVWQGGEFTVQGAFRPAAGGEQALSATGHTLEAAEKAFDRQREAAVAAGGAGSLTKTVVTPVQFKVTQLSQLLTLYYFAFFLLILPILGLRETPGRVPDTIAKAISAKQAAADRGA